LQNIQLTFHLVSFEFHGLSLSTAVFIYGMVYLGTRYYNNGIWQRTEVLLCRMVKPGSVSLFPKKGFRDRLDDDAGKEPQLFRLVIVNNIHGKEEADHEFTFR